MSMRSETEGPLFEGRFSDGRTAAASDVSVRLGPDGIEILRPGTAPPLVWAYAGLSAAQPLSPHAIDVLLGTRSLAGASLFVPSGLFARRLAEIAPRLTTRAVRRREAMPWLGLAAAVVAIAALVSYFQFSPARTVAGLLPDKARTAMGTQVMRSMTSGKRVCTDASGKAALDKLAARLSAAAGGSRTFQIVVVDWGLVNAFAAPGQQIVVTGALISKAESVDEVAGVLAHEMGHGVAMHPETSIVRALGLSAATELLFAGGAGTIRNVGLVLAQLSYTREAEREADAHALRILKAAKVSPAGLGRFMRRIAPKEGGESAAAPAYRPFDILRTHPHPLERARLIESQLPYSATPALSAEDWAALRAICTQKRPARQQEL
jgi:predicted Zn-dependent protease